LRKPVIYCNPKNVVVIPVYLPGVFNIHFSTGSSANKRYSAKCPVRDNCSPVLQGKVTHLLPGRTTGPYSPGDLIGTFLFFGFVALFPQYWPIRNLMLMLVFWILSLGNLVITHYGCCRGYKKQILSAAV